MPVGNIDIFTGIFKCILIWVQGPMGLGNLRHFSQFGSFLLYCYQLTNNCSTFIALTKVKSLRQACRKLAAHYLVRQRNLETVWQKCAASGTLPAHNRLRATESKVVRQNWNCVREVCHNYILSLNKL